MECIAAKGSHNLKKAVDKTTVHYRLPQFDHALMFLYLFFREGDVRRSSFCSYSRTRKVGCKPLSFKDFDVDLSWYELSLTPSAPLAG